MRIKALMHLVIFINFPFTLCIGQNYTWDYSYQLANDRDQKINDFDFYDNENILAVGNYYENLANNSKPIILSFANDGTLISDFKSGFDSLENGEFHFVKSIPNEPNTFYVGGFLFEIGKGNNDRILKIDSGLNIIWSKTFTYPTFYSGFKDAVVLPDKSIITVGEYLSTNSYDIIARRLDS